MNDYDGTLAKPELDDVLEHHGVKGMKWGIRRYQNKDGTYTSAGRRRYALDRDVNDKSRQNIAKIRTGEAKRRLDVAASKSDVYNPYRVAELKARVRSAKHTERLAKRMDAGAKLAAKGKTVKKENNKAFLAGLAAWKLAPAVANVTNIGLRAFNAAQKSKIAAGGTGKVYGDDFIRNATTFSQMSVYALAGAYMMKKGANASNLRAYNNARWSGDSTIKNIGSDEYASRVKKSKKK